VPIASNTGQKKIGFFVYLSLVKMGQKIVGVGKERSFS